jgi:hypothetical protein
MQHLSSWLPRRHLRPLAFAVDPWLGTSQGLRQPNGLPSSLNDVRPMSQSIDSGPAQAHIREHRGPLAKGQVGGHNHWPAFLPLAEDLEKELSIRAPQRNITQLVKYQYLSPAVASNYTAQFMSITGLGEFRRQSGGGDKSYRPALLGGCHPQGCGQMRLASPRFP